MSVYSRIQFCMPPGVSPKVELRRHPDLPVLMLSLSYGEGDVTIDGTAETLRGWLASILAHPLLAPTPEPKP
jgi:hypothetical protein